MKLSTPFAMLALAGLGVIFLTGVVWWLVLGWNLLQLALRPSPARARGQKRTKPVTKARPT